MVLRLGVVGKGSWMRNLVARRIVKRLKRQNFWGTQGLTVHVCMRLREMGCLFSEKAIRNLQKLVWPTGDSVPETGF